MANSDIDKPMETLTEEEIRAFVGSNADYFLKKWRPALEGLSNKAGFNCAAFCLSGFWFPYHKMYAATVGK